MPDTLNDTEVLLHEIIPQQEVEKLEFGRTEEILQPLLDLGYIKTADKVLIAEGIRLFRKDYLSLNLIPEFSPRFLFLPMAELEGQELSLLHTLTALAGDFTLELLPEIGEVNLCSRIIHYRLSIHNFFDHAVDSPFSLESLNALQNIRSWIGNLPKNSLDLFNLLGDIPTLIQHINEDKNGGLNKMIVAFKYFKVNKLSRFSVDVPDDFFSEVEEDENDQETENENETLQAETAIEEEIEILNNQQIFNNEEQQALRDESGKTKKRRAKLIRIHQMVKLVLAKQRKLSDDINERSNTITIEMNSLAQTHSNLIAEQKVLMEAIELLEKEIKERAKNLNKLDNRERQLKRKIKRGAKDKIIEALQEEIKTLKENKAKVEALEIEKSKLEVKIFLINEHLKNIDKRQKFLQLKMEALIQERNTVMIEKQKELILLLDRLDRLEDKVNKLKFSFRGRMKKVLDKDFYRDTVKKEIFDKRNGQMLETFCQSDYNNYLIRLIQIFQWTNGFYYGKLDSEVGNRTISALNDMVTYSRGLRVEFILSRLSENYEGTKGYWILNIKYLFSKLAGFIKDKNPSLTTATLIEKYEALYKDGNAKDTEIGNEVTDAGYREIVEENQEDIREGGSIRRIYYGIKSIATTLLDVLKELFQLIKKGIQKLIYLVKNLIKIIYKEIREGVRKFKEGLQFLFGNRQFITPTADGSAIFTKFDFDFDVTTFAPNKINDLERMQHNMNLFRFSNNLDFAMVLSAKVLKWVFEIIKLGTPIGWSALALKIALYYKRMIINWLIDLGRNISRVIIRIKYKLA